MAVVSAHKAYKLWTIAGIILVLVVLAIVALYGREQSTNEPESTPSPVPTAEPYSSTYISNILISCGLSVEGEDYSFSLALPGIEPTARLICYIDEGGRLAYTLVLPYLAVEESDTSVYEFALQRRAENEELTSKALGALHELILGREAYDLPPLLYELFEWADSGKSYSWSWGAYACTSRLSDEGLYVTMTSE